MSDPSAMKVFVTVVESGSFSAAGRKIGMTPSAVGKRIRALEERLGVDLLVRSTRKMALTEAGHRYLEDARDIAARITALEEDLREGATTLRGKITLTAPTAYGQRFVVPAVTSFMAENPEVEISLSLTDKIIDLVGEGMDLGIRTGVIQDSALIGRRVGPYRRWICASPDYLARNPAPNSLAELVSHRCLRLPSELSVSHWISEAEGYSGARLESGLVCNSLDALASACMAGQGIACIPDFIADKPIRDGRLQTVLTKIEYSASDQNILLIRPANTITARRVREFSDFLFKQLRMQRVVPV